MALNKLAIGLITAFASLGTIGAVTAGIVLSRQNDVQTVETSKEENSSTNKEANKNVELDNNESNSKTEALVEEKAEIDSTKESAITKEISEEKGKETQLKQEQKEEETHVQTPKKLGEDGTGPLIALSSPKTQSTQK